MGVFRDLKNYKLESFTDENINTLDRIKSVLSPATDSRSKNLSAENQSLRQITAAIERSQATIEFNPDGTVVKANQNFLTLLGYDEEEIVGRHHSMFVDPSYQQSQDYKNFWLRLGRGEFDSGEYLRLGKNGKKVWIQASYNPVFDETGSITKIIKFAMDITKRKLADSENLGKISAINQTQAVIEFLPDGTILTANEIFLELTGYQLSEIEGQHHRIFMPGNERETVSYAEFWANLGKGESQSGDFKRIGKNGSEVWINATYTPILNPDGEVFKVTKFATDITRDKLRELDSAGKITAIDKSQAVIEFRVDGTIIHANENFLSTMGYTLDEIKGRHHSLFVEPAYKNSGEYKEFWQKLNRGEFDSNEYLRLGKGGKEIWIQATYNPVLNPDGKVIKVVKFATDITAQKALQEMINTTMEDTSRVMNALSEGKLTVTMDGEYSGEFVSLANNINDYIDKLRSIVSEIKDSASSVKSGANEIAQGNINLSQRTEEQAASLEETSSAMEEITTTVQSNTENSNHADKLARGAREAAEKGGNVVGQAVIAMEEISESSNRIGEIINVIDTIAFQTNLLALNAAVEAARAGDQGKGFAVVADEVRELAGRSATAAKEIKELIQDSHNKVLEGSRLINCSGENLKEIVDEVQKVNAIVSEISSSSSEQSVGLIQISRAVQEMDQMTQQNAALVEEAAAASESLDRQAESLEELVSFFSLH